MLAVIESAASVLSIYIYTIQYTIYYDRFVKLISTIDFVFKLNDIHVDGTK